jgi:hypothetical protein
MRWFKPNLRNSLHAIFSSGLLSHPPDEPDTIITIEDIRHRMLDLLLEEESERATIARRRIRYADSVEALWFMRGEMVAVLARTRGEATALALVSTVSEMFDDLLPEGLRSRPSPLGRG